MLKFWFYLLCFDMARSQVDMGDCGCICGIGSSGGVISPESSSSSMSSFFNRVRGPKGDLGRPGKPGPEGPPGLKGLRGLPGPPGVSGNANGAGVTALSCLSLRGAGQSQSGIYTIKPTRNSMQTEVYCDMETAGGGWTLVASIHENNIYGKCTNGDNWSSDQGATNSSYKGGENWQNYNVFGSPESATSDDYKSSTYFNLLASDVMIWHVPNNVEIGQWSDQALLKYYTRNGFLSLYGGTLQTLYSKYYPMVATESSGTAYEGVVSILRSLNRTASNIRGTIPQFYNYNYDFSGIQNYIGDGGSDMYDTGNKVFFRIGTGDFTQIVYRKSYRDLTVGVDVSSTTEHPFIMLMWIGNQAGSVATFDIKVESGTGADGSGSHSSYNGAIVVEGFTLTYKSFNVYGANDPSICEVYFYISNANAWNSVNPTNFVSTDWSTGTDSLINTMRASGSPSRIMMGYTLLSRQTDSVVTETHMRDAMGQILQTISTFREIEDFNCSRVAESLVVPVSFAQGNPEDVLSRVPPSVREQVQPGYIHFKAIDPKGTPNALCPGVRSDACRPSSICIGGINTMSNQVDACGDFTGWNGNAQDSATELEPSGFAHSKQDIDSSILIFTRNAVSGRVQNREKP